MLLPIRTDVRMKNVPWMNLGLIFVNVGIFLVTTIPAHGGQPLFPFFRGQPVKEILALNPRDPHIWQYFTYQLLHESWAHIIGNMLFLYIFGNNINDRLGNLGYLAFYLAGGVVAGMGHVLISSSPVIGASGAIAAVTGAYIVLLPRSNITIIYFFFLVGALEVSSLWVLLFYFARDVLGQILPEWLGGGENVAHMAHISGTVFGAGLAIFMLWIGLLPRDQFDVLSLITRWNRRRQYRSLVSSGYNPFGYVQPPPVDVRLADKPPDARTQRLLELRAEISEAIAHRNLPHAAILFLNLKKLDPAQVLSRQSQLDVANQLASQQFYAEAADAYEQFLSHYPNYEQIEQVQLMLGIVYSRYLQNYQRSRQLLVQALGRLHTENEIRLAREELAHIEPHVAPGI